MRSQNKSIWAMWEPKEWKEDQLCLKKALHILHKLDKGSSPKYLKNSNNYRGIILNRDLKWVKECLCSVGRVQSSKHRKCRSSLMPSNKKKNWSSKIGETAQWMRAPAALAKDQVIPSTHSKLTTACNSIFRRSNALSGFSGYQARTWCTYTHIGNTHIHIK